MKEKIKIKGRVSEIELEHFGSVNGYFPGIYYTDEIFYSKKLKKYFVQRVCMNGELIYEADAFEIVSQDVIDKINDKLEIVTSKKKQKMLVDYANKFRQELIKAGMNETDIRELGNIIIDTTQPLFEN